MRDWLKRFREKALKINKNDTDISVIIAAINEEEGLGPTLEDLQNVLGDPRVIVVDGNSVDRTIEVAKKMGADVLLQEGKGKGAALLQGLKWLNFNSRYIVFTDADYTYPAEYVPKMIEIMEQDSQVGMVIGNRFNEGGSHKSLTNPFYIGNRLLAFAQHVLNGVKLEDPLSGLRVVRSDVLNGWAIKSKGFDIEAEINFRVEYQGYKIIEIPISYRRRLGEKKLKLRHGFGILKRIFSESIFT